MDLRLNWKMQTIKLLKDCIVYFFFYFKVGKDSLKKTQEKKKNMKKSNIRFLKHTTKNPTK